MKSSKTTRFTPPADLWAVIAREEGSFDPWKIVPHNDALAIFTSRYDAELKQNQYQYCMNRAWLSVRVIRISIKAARAKRVERKTRRG